jgi:phosphoglycolate phosphatase
LPEVILRSYDLYIFDLDDTLVRTFDTVATVHYPALARQLGIPAPTPAAIREHWGGDLAQSLAAAFGPALRDPAAAVSAVAGLHERYPVQAVDGAARALDMLKKHGKAICLFTAGQPAVVDTEIRRGLGRDPDFFDFIYTVAEQGMAKPSPHIIYLLMDAMRRQTGREIGLERVLVMGDSLHDYATARAAGVDFAGVLTGPVTREQFMSAGLPEGRIFADVSEALRPPDQHGIVAIIHNPLGQILMVQEGRPGHEYLGCWSGPHGTCETFDVIEEETVARETWEEAGIHVRPTCLLYRRGADTKVQTVSFWEAELLDPSGWRDVAPGGREVARLAWFDLEEILSGAIPLYPGTVDFFAHYRGSGRTVTCQND